MLFLGAGASLGATAPNGEQLPTTTELSVALADEFLGGEDADKPLGVIAELAISETDLTTVQSFIHDTFRDFQPAAFHRLIPTFRWAALATTNFDLLIEHAYQDCKQPAQELVPFYKNADRVDAKLRTPTSVPYIKLHGCISRHTDLTIPLILTTDQYVTHRRNRNSLFDRVKYYAGQYTVVFVGHSLADSDVRQILLELSEEGTDRSRYYIVAPNFSDRQRRFWETKKITALPCSFAEFVAAANTALDPALRAVSTPPTAHPLEGRIVKSGRSFSEPTLALLRSDLTFVREDMPCPLVSPEVFYKGASLGWSPIQQNLDAPRRLTDSMLSDCILLDEVDRPTACDFYLVKGHAGAGKTTFLKRLAWEAAVTFSKTCLYYSSTARLPYEAVAEIADLVNDRLFLFLDRPVDHVSDLTYLLRRARRESQRITVFCTERANEWNVECGPLKVLLNDSFDLKYLSLPEIGDLLAKLEENNALGLLADLTEPQRVAAFAQKAGRQLLVALHEATMGKTFEEIIYDEYCSIEPETARNIYLTICSLNRLDVLVRAGLVKRVHGVSFSAFRERFFLPLESIVQTLDYVAGRDMAYQARHPWIAETVFERALVSPDERYDLYMRLLDAVDVGYSVDRIAFRRLIRARDLLQLFHDPVLIRTLFKKAHQISSDDAYVYQQDAIFEMRRENPNFSAAYDLLSVAERLAPYDKSITHTLAELELERSKHSNNPIEYGRHITSAKQLARSLTSKDTDSSYGFHTLCKLGLDELQQLLTGDADNDDRIDTSIKALERELEAGLQRFPDDQYLLDAEARLARLVKDDVRAMESLARAFRGNPASPFVAKGLARLYAMSGDLDAARSTLETCLDHRPGDKGTNAALARLITEHFPAEGMKAEYHWRRAFTDGDANYSTQFWYARQLYVNGKTEDAMKIFRGLQSAPVSPEVRHKIRGILNTDEGLPTRFKGRVERLEATYALVSQLGGRDWAFLHRNKTKRDVWNRLSRGTSVNYRIGFTYNGLAAFDIALTV